MPLPALCCRSVQVNDKTVKAKIWGVAALSERLVQDNSTAGGRWCTAAPPDVSLCGARRRGALRAKREDLRRFGLWALRLSFTTENPGEIDTVLSNLNAPFDPGACTRGLYYRGVE